jgi:hypothetical protein
VPHMSILKLFIISNVGVVERIAPETGHRPAPGPYTPFRMLRSKDHANSKDPEPGLLSAACTTGEAPPWVTRCHASGQPVTANLSTPAVSFPVPDQHVSSCQHPSARCPDGMMFA